MKTTFLNKRDHPNLSREVIRSYYGSDSQPDMTHVTVKVVQLSREERTYECEVTVEGRVHIDSNTNYTHDTKGTGASSVTVTGKQLMCIYSANYTTTV